MSGAHVELIVEPCWSGTTLLALVQLVWCEILALLVETIAAQLIFDRCVSPPNMWVKLRILLG